LNELAVRGKLYCTLGAQLECVVTGAFPLCPSSASVWQDTIASLDDRTGSSLGDRRSNQPVYHSPLR